jgi:hypothetical protein
MIDSRHEQLLLPHLGEVHIPAVRRERVDAWRRMGHQERAETARSFARRWTENGIDGVRAHPWWDVLSNLSVARFAIDEDD